MNKMVIIVALVVVGLSVVMLACSSGKKNKADEPQNDENEVFDIFDRAFGNNPTQEGILTYKVNKNSDSIDVYLKVGDISIPFEKTQVNIYARDMKTGEYTDVYNNIEGEEHQQFTGYRYY